ncbi:protein kinase PINOID 2-like [Olea europaea var. sylvestris]|uniref:protein kinase PINOID 2-like n=1 Tax=Olea europaea var. sylvestris TaxID=158386 RepID=UPI000C1D8380|nr:protein kinase PINOID 2-like [Olea europaea var. sylvestris]
MASIIRDREDSDYYESSSCSSITVPDSTRSWLSSLSFGSHRSSTSASLSSSSDIPFSSKPHKANQTAWEAMRLLHREKGQVGLEHFKPIRRLGGGDIGNLYLCQMRNPVDGLQQCLNSMKVVDREALAIRKKLQRAEMEKQILGMLDHPFLPTLYAQFDASHYSCLVMEFSPGGDLHAARQRQPVKRFSISSAKFYATETLLAIEYLHMLGIVYRDLKPENVLVRGDGHIMLSDFDLSLKCESVPKLIRSKLEQEAAINKNPVCSTPSCAMPIQPMLSCFSTSMKEGLTKDRTQGPTIPKLKDVQQYNSELVAEPINARSKSFVGTHEYLAPEVISGQGHGSAVDWWTFGVFLYELLYSMTPFKGENNEKTLINILKQSLTFPRVGISSSKEYE